MQEFSIGDVMRITGLSRAAILYYEQKSLIHPRQNSDTGYRYYTVEDLSQVMFYQNMKQMDISVTDFADAIGGDGGNYSDVEALLMAKKQAYLRKISAYLNMVRYWDQAISFLHVMRDRPYFLSEQSSYAAWTYAFSDGKEKNKEVLRQWDDFFLQRNLCYFFDTEGIERRQFHFQRGIGCYADCALEPTPEMRKGLTYRAPQRSLALITAFDLREENFAPVFDVVENYLRAHHLKRNGAPWGHNSIRNDQAAQGRDNLFLWVPVTEI